MLPPSLAGGLKVTMTLESWGVTMKLRGTLGGPKGVAMADADGTLTPAALCAITEQVTATPAVKPLTVMGLAAPVVGAPAEQVAV